MTTSTLPAAQVVSALGRLPAVWRGINCVGVGMWLEAGDNASGCLVALSDPQTAFGVALLLDVGERAGDTGNGWLTKLVLAIRLGANSARYAEVCRAMIARITDIALDHEVRRALGMTVEPGTLATVKRFVAGIWFLDMPDGERWSFQDYDQDTDDRHRHVPALAGITDPAEALRAIHAELTGGS